MVDPEPTIRVHVPPPLRECCGGARELALPAATATVRGVLAELERRHPALYERVCDETGAVRRHLNVFVNGSHIRERTGLDTAVAPGDLVVIMTAVSGG